MTLVSGQGSASDETDLVALLERLERENPELAAAALDREIDSLLERTPAASRTASPVKASAEPLHRRKRTGEKVFEWFTPLVARHPLLSPEETQQCAREVEAGLFAEEYLATHPTAEMQRRHVADLHQLVETGQRSFERLVLSNLRLVFHWSKGIASQIDSDWAQDAFQVGCIGLIRGIQGWDYAKGFSLSTYVSWHIRQAIQRWRANDILLVRLPVHVWEALDGSPEKMTPAVRAAADRSQNMHSLDEMSGEEAWFEYDGGLEDAGYEVDRTWLVSHLLNALDEREAEILRLRHGLGDADPMTLDEIGVIFKVTRERIRQLERKAVTQLRAMAEKEHLAY